MTHIAVCTIRMQQTQNNFLYKAYFLPKKLMQERIGKKQIHESTVGESRHTLTNWDPISKLENLSRFYFLDQDALELVKTTSLSLKSDFLKGMTHTSVRITHMQPIQNSYLYKAYVIQKKLMQEGNGKEQIHERTLFHGTRTTSPGLIWKSDHGFDLRHCRQGAWGIGAYFAESSQYSHAYAYHHGRVRQMFVARVWLIMENTHLSVCRN